MKRYIVAFTLVLIVLMDVYALPPRTVDFNSGWKFLLVTDSATCNQPVDVNYNDAQWRKLTLPHDWSIESDFSDQYPASPGGGALPGGIGWYRKSFTLHKDTKGKRIFIDFDGVYCSSEVWINGHYLGKRPFGYIGFRYDLTPFVRFDQQNIVAVKVDNSHQPNSRWYSGSGIYRNVWLTTVSPVHVAHWGTHVKTQIDDKNNALLGIETTVNNFNSVVGNVTVRQVLLDSAKRKIVQSEKDIALRPNANDVIPMQLQLTNPVRWDIDRPYLYTLNTIILSDGKPVDSYSTNIGVRSFEFHPTQGFFLNGRHLKINGVCNHHDLGALGAAVNVRAMERQLQILKAMGVNGIRTSHNPPAPELLDLCDRMGFIVMDEAFDMWKKKKTTYDYSEDFAEWHERDLTDMLLRDRNHPSIFSWSIGNEVGEQWANTESQDMDLQQANILLNAPKSQAADAEKVNLNALLTTHLVDIVKKHDSTRPVTAGCNETGDKNPLFVSNSLDMIGFNYHENDFAAVPQRFPGKPFVVTESVSSLQTRGFYLMPSDSMHIWPVRWDIPFHNPIQKCSAYDNNHAPWGSTHETSWKMVKKMPHIAGQYIWTGFDYLGEPTPYWWPSRSSYFGIVDLAGFPKDVYYMYQSEWTSQNVLHIFPHWNWQPGQTVDVWAYYNNADEVELFLNGKSLGKRAKQNDELHVMWRVAYEAGTLTAVSRKNGQKVLESIVKTASAPVSIRLTADRNTLAADGRDLSFVTVELVDKDGTAHPLADKLVKFTVEGPAFIAGTDNGCQYDHNSLKKPERQLYYGKALCIVQTKNQKGKITLKAAVEGLPDAFLTLTAR